MGAQMSRNGTIRRECMVQNQAEAQNLTLNVDDSTGSPFLQ